MSERKTAVQREREGAIMGGCGVILALAGLGIGHVPLLVIGVLAAIAGLVMWGAGMARRD